MAVAALPFAALVLFTASFAPAAAVVTREEARYVMGTVATVNVAASGEAAALAALDAAWAAFGLVDARMSTWRDDSDLARVNAGAALAPVEAPGDLIRVVAAALRVADETGGAFDPTVLPLLRAWGLQGGSPREPTADELADVLAVTGARHVRVDSIAGTIGFARDGVALDLGGIAKGFALDLAREAMTTAGAVAGVLDLGGNLLVFGPAREEIGIVDPDDPTRTVAMVPVENAAVATSGQYERHVEIDGRRRGHILDPRSGLPVDRRGSVTIVSPSGILADALATAVFVLGVEAGEELVARHPGTGCVIVIPDAAGRWCVRRSGTLAERP